MKKKKDTKEKFSIKVKFNPDLPLDAELLKILNQQTNMTAYIKFALYHYINGGAKDGTLNAPVKMVHVQKSLQKDLAVSQLKEKPIHQWDKDAAFADAFEPLK